MKKIFLIFLFLAFSVPVVFAGDRVDLPNGPSGYLAMPESLEGNEYPLLLLVHDWWGINDSLKERADELAREGFVCFVIDLYGGRVPVNAVQAYELMQLLNSARALKSIKQAQEYLGEYPSVNPLRTGVLGWSYGAKLALEYSLVYPRSLHALGLFYPQVKEDEESFENLRVPVIGFFGEQDKGIPIDFVNNFKFRLEQMHKRVQIHFYPEEIHGFFNPENLGYSRDAAEDSWQKTLDFFRVNLA